MAIYHLHVKVIGRKAGSSAVASAAYRSASRLRDDRLERSHDFSNKRGVVHSEVMLPEDAPEQWSDRERLWNDVEAFEVRKDAQLAREVEFALPREMTQAQGIELSRDFVQAEFVDQGMIADLNVHWDMAEDGTLKPHAHIMLTMRSMEENGFGRIDAISADGQDLLSPVHPVLIPERNNPGRGDGRVHPVAVRDLVKLGLGLEIFQFFISEFAHKSVIPAKQGAL
jgi:hypothetical protein